MDQTDPVPGEEMPEPARADAPAEPAPQRRSGGRRLFVLIVLGLLAGAGAWGWLQWQRWQAEQRQSAAGLQLVDQLQQQNATLDDLMQQVRQQQHSSDQRIAELGSANRVLREELLGIGARAAALEDALSRLARARREGAQALKLEEIDFVLQLAAERLQLFDDPAGATQAMQLAADSLDSVDDPAIAGVRQTLAQELALLRAVPPDPRPPLHAAVQSLRRHLDDLPMADHDEPAAAADAPQWQRLLGSLVRIRRVDADGALLTPVERATRLSALKLQLGLAQSALERGDAALWQSSLTQAQALFDGLFERSAPATQAAAERLRTLLGAETRRSLPSVGAALHELRNLRATRRMASGPAAAEMAAAAPASEQSAASPAVEAAAPEAAPIEATPLPAEPELERERP